MFLNTNTEGVGIEDFLKSMNFIAPNGQDLKYFIVPLNQNNQVLANAASTSGFEPLANENQIKGVTDNIVYSKRDFKSKQSVSKPNLDPTEVPEEFPISKEMEVPSTPNAEGNMSTDVLIAGGAILPPGSGVKVVKPDANISPIHVGNMPRPVMQQTPTNANQTPTTNVPNNKAMTVVESTEKTYDFILNEAVGYFPANTLFHFTKD